MTAHIIYEAIDPNNLATLSKKIISYIKDQLGFKGLIIIDAIEMKALTDSKANIAKRALGAGADIVLLCTGNSQDSANVLGVIPKIFIDKFADLFID